MIQRCDDTQKAKWLSQLFHELVLKRGENLLFMRAEKILSSLSVMDMMNFLAIPQSSFPELSIDNGEPYANSGLYRVVYGGLEDVEDGYLGISDTKMRITVVGKWIYMTLNGRVQSATKQYYR